ncbi:MAG: outer membrane lipoprotein carrier protein LolA [Pseudorhodobacter sp.]|nr:outer membrane lipoprotein carrier protein LolA [Pseudorhodobacter sp.]
MGVMSIARLLLALLAFAAPALAEKVSLADLSAYLNGITTAEAGFSQINSDGSTITGRVFIKRPGRMRFEYAPPDHNLVLASGGQVAIFDGKSNQPPEQYPLKRTPLNLILVANVDLGRARMVTGHVENGATTLVQAQDPEHPEYGRIDLLFTADPIALRQWVITDDAGGQTAVILGPMAVGGDYPPSLFSITSETDKRLR